LAIVGGVSLALAVASPVEAACTSDRTYGTYPSAGLCGNYCYIFTPGDNLAASVKGFYWVLGEGATRNSGGYEFDGTGGSQPWYIPGSPFVNGWSLTTTVNNGQTVGCPAPDTTAWIFSDTSPSGGLYGLAVSDEDLSNFLNYDLGIAMGSGGRLTLQPVPNLTIVGAHRLPNGEIEIGLGWVPNGASAFQTNSATITSVDPVLTGWRLYKHEAPAGGAPPASLAVADWDLLTTFAGTTTNTGTMMFQCDLPLVNAVYLALAPDLDDGFKTTAYVGGTTTAIICDPNVADPVPRKRPAPADRPRKLRQR
jgi:hypothetical protein